MQAANRVDTLRRSVLKNSGWAISVQGVNAVAALAETILLARFLSLDSFGALIVLTSAVDFVFGVLDFRTGQAVIKFAPEYAVQGVERVGGFLRMVLLIDLTIAAAGLGCIIVFGSAIAHVADLSDGFRRLMIVLAVGGALKSLVRSAGSYLRVSGAFGAASTLSIVASCVRIAIIIAVVTTDPTLASIAYGLVAADLLFFVLMASALFHQSRRNGHNPLTATLRSIRPERRAIWTFLLSTNLESTIKTVSNKVDVLLLALLTTPGAVAIYKVATRIAGTFLLFSDPLLMAVYPEMARAEAEGKMDEMQGIIKVFTRWLLTLGAVGLAVFAAGGRWLVQWLAGPEYVAAHAAALVMTAGTLLAMTFFWARPLLLVKGRSRALVGVISAAAAAQFILFALLAPSMGALGGAIGYSAFFAISALSCRWLLLRTARGLSDSPRVVGYQMPAGGVE